MSEGRSAVGGAGRRVGGVGRALRAAAPWAWFLEDEVAGLERHVGPGAVCLDVGAQYGLYTWALASLVGAGGQVHAVEPQPGPAGFIRTSARALGARQVAVHQLALGAVGGSDTLSLPCRRGLPVHGRAFLTTGSSGLGSNAEFRRHDEVPVTVRTLDDLVEELDLPRVDFVKADVEGAEASLLAGASTTLARHAPVLVLELEDRHLERFGTTVTAIRADLEARGYTARQWTGSTWGPATTGPAAPRNTLFVPAGRA